MASGLIASPSGCAYLVADDIRVGERGLTEVARGGVHGVPGVRQRALLALVHRLAHVRADAVCTHENVAAHLVAYGKGRRVRARVVCTCP